MIYIFKKIILLIKKIFNKEIKLKFSIPKETEIIVYNSESKVQLHYVLKGKKFVILDFDLEQIKEVYITFELILKIISNLYKFNLSKNYFFSIIKIINPKVVLTSVGNHKIFYELAKLLDKKIIFIAIQNARRSDFERNDYDFEKGITKKNLNFEIYIPHFFCFGQHEIDCAKLYNLNINKFFKIGSLNTANFFYYLKQNQKTIIKNKFDVCLVSEPQFGDNNRYKSKGVEEGYGLMADYTVKFAKKFNYNFLFAVKRSKESKLYSTDLFKQEINFYKTYLSKDSFDYLLKHINSKENFYSSYFAIFQSKVAVGTQSTLLRDKIGVGEKILSCNLTGLKIQDFPINGICSIKDCTYEQFEKRMSEIISISTEEYFNKIDKDKSYVMKYNNPFGAIEDTKKEIDKFLKK